MNKIAIKNVDSKELADTGERMIPAYHKSHSVYGEHIVRYQAAVDLVKDKVVLDIASGSGYGSSLLAATASKVYGVDVDEDALAYATKNYKAKNIIFKHGSGTAIPLEDSMVDVVVCFETIEHIKDYKKFMSELKRVLKPDGLLILSTPNDVEFPESNHFHIHEFERKELEDLVSQYFKYTKSYFQGAWIYNALIDEDLLRKEWDQPIRTMQLAPIKPNKSIYFYMLCSNRKLVESVEPLAGISEHWSARRIEEYEQSVRKHMNDQAAIMDHQKHSLETKDQEIAQLKSQLSLFQSTGLKRHFGYLKQKVSNRIKR